MALIGISQPDRPYQQPHQNTMQQIAEGLNAAANILGIGINAYKTFGIDKPAQEAQSNYMNAEAAALPVRYGYMNANPGEANAHTLAGQPNDQLFVPKNEQKDAMQALRMTTQNDDKEEHDAEILKKSLDVSVASSRSPLGKAANNFYASQKVRTLIDQNPNPTPQQMYEIARATDTILSQSGSTLGGTEHLVPKSAIGDFNSWKNYLDNQPGGAGQQSWVQNLKDTVNREGELSRNQINAKLDAVAKGSAGGRLARNNPGRYNDIVSSYRDSLLNLQVPIVDTSALSSGSIDQVSAGGGNMPQVGQVISGHKFIGGNPNDPKSWSAVGP